MIPVPTAEQVGLDRFVAQVATPWPLAQCWGVFRQASLDCSVQDFCSGALLGTSCNTTTFVEFHHQDCPSFFG